MSFKRFRCLLLAAFAALLLTCEVGRAQAQKIKSLQPPPDTARLERLAGLAKVWGAVKYFHPFLAYREIDWDKALIETIPQVNSARTPQEYGAAINSMLAALADKTTRAEIETGPGTETKSSQPEASKSEAVRLDGPFLTVEVLTIAKALAADQSAAGQFFSKISALLPQAKGVILDCRPKAVLKEAEKEYVNYFFDDFLRNAVAQFSDRPIRLGTLRYRIHNGYAPQAGGTSGGYYSALIETAPETIAGEGQNALPVAVIINAETPDEMTVFSGLQAAGKVAVVHEGEEYGGTATYKIKLPDNVTVSMRKTEVVNPDGSIGFRPDAVVAKSPQDLAMKEALRILRENGFRPKGQINSAALQQGVKDNPYPQMKFPSAEYRLLALFRFWNVINYFYPYKNLIGESWETVLPRYIQKFEADKDALDYQTTVRELAAELHDSHAFVSGAGKLDEKFGEFMPPVWLRYVGNQVVAEKVLDDKTGPLRPGDAILTIDGEPVERRRESLTKLIAAATPQGLNSSLKFFLLRGQKESKAKLTVRDMEGRVKEVEVARAYSIKDPKLYALLERTTPVVQVLPSGFGYVDLARLQLGEVDKMFETIKSTPATIFDMRGYPNGTAWAIAPRLTEKKMIAAALFSRPLWEAKNLGESDYAGGTDFTFQQYLPEASGEIYRGKVVMLVNEDAVSQAEHTCLFFEAATNVTFIGTPTKGTNGDVTNMILPGNIALNFSGHSVRHADGRQLQRVGIQPQVKVEPTIRGIAAGQDEILEAAVKYLTQAGK